MHSAQPSYRNGSSGASGRAFHEAQVVRNELVTRDHFRLSMAVPHFPPAAPGQFLHVAPPAAASADYRLVNWSDRNHALDSWIDEVTRPMLRRAYSIAGLRMAATHIELDILYRVVGAGTQWLRTLQPGEALSVLGPLGNVFPISPSKKSAWLIAGGVGLPPLLWLAQYLRAAGKNTTLFYGAQTADLLAVTLRGDSPPDPSARTARHCVEELADLSVVAVLSTDDGSVGLRGHVGAALHAFSQAHPPDPHDVVLYTCGPERMMRFVADFCAALELEGYACMERAMACGTGTCQSCAVPVADTSLPDGWRYSLCCTEGPVYAVRDVCWEVPATVPSEPSASGS